MNNFAILALAGAAGLALGAIFFGGLWWTIRKGISSKHAPLWFLGSLLVRMSVILPGFYFTGRDDWRRLVACLFGFIIARSIVIRLTRPPVARQHSSTIGEEALLFQAQITANQSAPHSVGERELPIARAKEYSHAP